MTPSEIHNLVTAIGDLVGVLRTADPADKAAVYRHLGLKLTYMQEAALTHLKGPRSGSLPHGERSG